MNLNFHELLRRDVFSFARQAHFELHQSALGDDAYLHLLAHDIERIVSGEIPFYNCNVPPGHGKTFMCSVTMPAWVLGKNPSARILVVSYGEAPATEISRKIRTILQARWYRNSFPQTALATDQARDFTTTAGGQVFARSLDGAVTGLHCDILIADDLVQIRDCGNLAYLQAVNARFDSDLITRLNNPEGGTVVNVQQRLNKFDLTGHLQNRKGWTHRVLPLTAIHDCSYPLKNGIWRRKAGEVLRPNAFSAGYIAQLRENTGAPGFGPLYQQSFDGPDMLQIRREDFVIEPFYAPPAVPFFLSIDLNHKGEHGQSYSVIECWALLADGRYLLYDLWRARAHKNALADHIRRMKTKYRPSVILIEDNGPALDLQEQFNSPSCPVHLVKARGDKLSRLRRHLDLFRRRQVVLPAGAPFVDVVISEFESFPYGDHDDLVDSATQFFDLMQSNDLPMMARPQPVMGVLGNVRRARAMLYWNAGRPTRYVFSRR